MNTTRISAFAAAAALALGALGSSAALAQVATAPAPTKVFDANSTTGLIGLNGVTVDGSTYDVRFVTQTSCMATFSGCDSASDFTFRSEATARLASQALLTALVDGSDFSPFSLVGVSVRTPYGISASNASQFQFADVSMAPGYGPAYQSVSIGTYGREWQLSWVPDGGQRALAVWTASVSAVPEPGTYALMAAGLGALGCRARRSAVKAGQA